MDITNVNYDLRQMSPEKHLMFWQLHIQCWNDGPLSVSTYCQKNGLARSTFYKWLTRNSYTKSKKKKKKLANLGIFIERDVILSHAFASLATTGAYVLLFVLLAKRKYLKQPSMY